MPGRLVSRNWMFQPHIDAPPKYRRACRYAAFIPDSLTDLDFSLEASVAGVISDAEDAIRRLNSNAAPALKPLARLLLRTESIASSKIEGMQLGARELARAEAKSDLGMTVGQSAREILANIDAMVLAVDQAALAQKFGVGQIKAIHRRLMESSSAKQLSGKIRTEQNWIGGNDYNPCGADFVPPPPENVLELLDDLCAAINDDTLPPIVQAALVHAQFESIHPFGDGNGRTGRALIHVVFKRRGIAPNYVPPISVVLARARDRYIGGLTKFRGSGLAEWIEQFAAAASRSAKLAESYLEAVAVLVENWGTAVRRHGDAPRAQATVWSVLEILPAHPIVTAPVLTALTGRVKASVYEAIRILENAKVLLPLSSSARNRAWEARGLLDLVEGLEGGRTHSR